MDIVSHGLWGALAFGRKDRTSFWLAFGIGLAPDLFSFGILWVAATLGLSPKPDFTHGTPPESTIPPYVHHLYDVTHKMPNENRSGASPIPNASQKLVRFLRPKARAPHKPWDTISIVRSLLHAQYLGQYTGLHDERRVRAPS